MKLHFNTVIEKEGAYFVAHCLELGVVSQGQSVEDAQKNLKEAVNLYLEDIPAIEKEEISAKHPFITSFDLDYA